MEQHLMLGDITTKVCSRCGEEKPLTSEYFHKYKPSKDGLRAACKECRKLETKEYYENNKEQVLEKNKKWVESNKERVKKNKRDWAKKKYWENPEKQREKNNLYRRNNPHLNTKWTNKQMKKRLKEDPIFKMKHSIRNRINRFNNTNKKTQEILGCSYKDFKLYIEKQFQEGMTWENHGEWHYDHIIPISLAKNEKMVLSLNHYTNFQPLWKKDNLKKSNKLDLDLWFDKMIEKL